MGKKDESTQQEMKAIMKKCTEKLNGLPKKLKTKIYNREIARLQTEMVKLQEWIKLKGLKVVVIFEGRDAAGKGGVIKRVTALTNPRICPDRGLGNPHRAGKDAMVFSALYCTSAGSRRNGAL